MRFQVKIIGSRPYFAAGATSFQLFGMCCNCARRTPHTRMPSPAVRRANEGITSAYAAT